MTNHLDKRVIRASERDKNFELEEKIRRKVRSIKVLVLAIKHPSQISRFTVAFATLTKEIRNQLKQNYNKDFANEIYTSLEKLKEVPFSEPFNTKYKELVNSLLRLIKLEQQEHESGNKEQEMKENWLQKELASYSHPDELYTIPAKKIPLTNLQNLVISKENMHFYMNKQLVNKVIDFYGNDHAIIKQRQDTYLKGSFAEYYTANVLETMQIPGVVGVIPMEQSSNADHLKHDLFVLFQRTESLSKHSREIQSVSKLIIALQKLYYHDKLSDISLVIPDSLKKNQQFIQNLQAFLQHSSDFDRQIKETTETNFLKDTTQDIIEENIIKGEFPDLKKVKIRLSEQFVDTHSKINFVFGQLLQDIVELIHSLDPNIELLPIQIKSGVTSLNAHNKESDVSGICVPDCVFETRNSENKETQKKLGDFKNIFKQSLLKVVDSKI
jgi:hypothetical protein